MCKYCEPLEDIGYIPRLLTTHIDLGAIGEDSVEVYIYKGALEAYHSILNDETIAEYADKTLIKYCPMCGGEL